MEGTVKVDEETFRRWSQEMGPKKEEAVDVEESKKKKKITNPYALRVVDEKSGV